MSKYQNIMKLLLLALLFDVIFSTQLIRTPQNVDDLFGEEAEKFINGQEQFLGSKKIYEKVQLSKLELQSMVKGESETYQLLGSGTYSNVYQYNENLAIKVFTNTTRTNRIYAVHEYYLSKKLNNTNLFVQYHALVTPKFNTGLPVYITYMIMEKCYGTMEDLINKHGGINDKSASEKLVNTFIDMNDELKKSHIIHGDIKIENLLVCPVKWSQKPTVQ